MTLIDLRDLLLTVGVPIFHYEAHEQDGNYIVWAEDGQGDTVSADNQMEDQVIQGTIDYYTKKEFDSIFETIQQTLNSAEISWKLNSIQHERETGYIHYEWIWELV